MTHVCFWIRVFTLALTVFYRVYFTACDHPQKIDHSHVTDDAERKAV